PDDERLAICAGVHEAPALGGRHAEHFAVLAGRRGICGRDEILAIGSEEGEQGVDLAGLRDGDERLDRLVGRFERASLRRLCRGRRDERREQHAGQDQGKESAMHDFTLLYRRLPPPPLRLLLLRLRCPRSLEARDDFPLEYPENASVLAPL